MRLLLSYLNALLFLLRIHTGLVGSRPARARRIVLRGGSVELDVYEPRSCRSVILLVHGLVPAGQKDPAIVDLARALARVGCRVLVPHFASMARLEIDPDEHEGLAEILITVTLDRALCPAGRIALLSGSYPAAVALRAAGDPELAERIAAICVAGAFIDPERVLIRALEGNDLVRWTAYKNFLDHYSGSSRPLQQAYGVALADRLAERTLPELEFRQVAGVTRRALVRISVRPPATALHRSCDRRSRRGALRAGGGEVTEVRRFG